MSVRIRRARPEDVDFLVALANHEEVEPFLAGSRARDREAVAAEVDRSLREPHDYGRFVIEVDDADGDEGEGGWRLAGSMGFELKNRRSRIAHLGGLAVHPEFRGRRIADEAARMFDRHLLFDLDYHRLELEIYGFNERAIRHAERIGFVREGVRRRAYWRHGDWVDGVLYGLLCEDLERVGSSLERVGSRGMELIHTCYRITDVDRSVAFYEALGFEERGRFPIRDEAINVFMGLPGDGDRLELTYNFGVESYELGTGYGHIAVTVEDLDATLERLGGQGIEPERPPYRVREGGSRLCFVRDPDGYRIELIERG
jgi:lactoylglutathione lyase